MGHTVGINVSAIYYVRSSFFSTWIVIRCSRTNTPGSGYRTYRRYRLLPILRDTGISLGIALRPIFWDPGIVPRYRLRRILRDPGISLGIALRPILRDPCIVPSYHLRPILRDPGISLGILIATGPILLDPCIVPNLFCFYQSMNKNRK